jgi:iron complex outermembrane receptor protein
MCARCYGIGNDQEGLDMSGWKSVIGSLAVLMFIAAQQGRAEEKKRGGIELDEIVVTATKTEKQVDDAPASVTVITEAEMERRNIETVDDALAEIPGIFVKRSKGLMDSTTAVRSRGFNGDEYTLVLVDGQPQNDAYTGGVEWGALPTDNIERIEVIRGAASALYGGNAMGGVINIITKTPEKLELKATAGFGTNDTRKYSFSAGNRFTDKLSLRVGYEYEGTDGYANTPVVASISTGSGTHSGGYATTDKSGNPRWVVGDKGDNGAERYNINGKVVLDYSDTGRLALTAAAGHHEYDYGAPHSLMGTFGDSTTYAIAGTNQRARFRPNDFINYTGIGEDEDQSYTLSVDQRIGVAELHFQAGAITGEDRYTLESGSGLDDYDTSAGTLSETDKEGWFSELRASMALGQSHLLTLGVSYRADKSDTDQYTVPFYRSFGDINGHTYYAGGKDSSWGVFVQEEWQAAPPLTVYLGGRYDTWKVYDGASGTPGALTSYDEHSDSAFSPRAAMVWKAASFTTLRASAGHAFRPPTLYELYRTWQGSSGISYCNPELDPETVRTYEVGVDQYLFGKRTKLSLTGYRNDIEDLIYDKAIGSDKIRQNAGKARTYGVELELTQKITSWLTLWGNFTYTDAKITDNPTDPDSEDKQVTGIPERTWNAGLDATYGWLKAGLVGRYFSKIYGYSDHSDTAEGVYSTYEPSFVMDAKVTLSPWKWTQIAVSVSNIFDETYYQYYEGEGRTVLAELTLRY